MVCPAHVAVRTYPVTVRACYGPVCQDAATLTIVKMVATAAKNYNFYWVDDDGAVTTWANCKSDAPLSGASACTLATALTNVVAGDTVWLRGGSYAAGILVNAKDGTARAKITFAAYPGETPEIRNTTNGIWSGYFEALRLYQSDYIVLRGISFYALDDPYVGGITHTSSHNEIDHCYFDGGYGVAADTPKFMVWTGTSATGEANAATYNWIHDNTFTNFAWGVQIGTYATTAEMYSGRNTMEGNLFEYGGHHTLETYSKYNIVRGNSFHNEGWRTTGQDKPPDSNGKYGDRNTQIYGGYSADVFNLVEGNRYGPSGPGSNDDGGDGLTICSPKNLIRLNEVYGAQNNGVLFKTGGFNVDTYALSDNNRFYRNTVYASGRYNNMAPSSGAGIWQGAAFRWYGSYARTGNIITNNIFRTYGGVSEWYGGSATIYTDNTVENNYCTTAQAGRCVANGDPLFVSTTYDASPFRPLRQT